jgi:hypothetical protein
MTFQEAPLNLNEGSFLSTVNSDSVPPRQFLSLGLLAS